MGLAVVTVDGFLMPGYRMESEVMPIMTRLVFKLIAIAIAVASVTTIQPASAVTVSEQEAYDLKPITISGSPDVGLRLNSNDRCRAI